MGLGWLVACLIFSLIMVGLYKLLWSTVLTCSGRPTRGAIVDRPSTLWSTDQRPSERCRTELNETAVFRTVLERFRTDLTTFDAKIDDWKASSFGVYFLLKAHYCCMLSIKKTKQNKETDPFNSFFSTTDWTDRTDLLLGRKRSKSFCGLRRRSALGLPS